MGRVAQRVPLVSTPDPTPPSAPLPAWARQLQRAHEELRKDHERLKSKQAADTIAHIHLLAQIADSVTAVSVDVTKLNRQIWGAIKELRKK